MSYGFFEEELEEELEELLEEEEEEDDDDCSDDNPFFFDQLTELFGRFTLDIDKIDFRLLGKMVDWDVSADGFSVSFGKGYALTIDAHDIAWSIGKGGLPTITKGTIDAFTFESPGMADFSISGLDMSAKHFAKALMRLDTDAIMKLLLGGDETISGSGYDDFLFAGKGDDTLIGNEGDDKLVGGVGRDILEGGAGDDCLVGGVNADIFVFAPGSGEDTIVDFAKNDRIDLSAWGFASFDELAENIEFEGCGKNTSMSIELDSGTEITLKNVHWWQISDANFIL